MSINEDYLRLLLEEAIVYTNAKFEEATERSLDYDGTDLYRARNRGLAKGYEDAVEILVEFGKLLGLYE